jgi:hypothetical protein
MGMRSVSGLAGAVALAAVAGCILVTGGTNGYTSSEGGLSGQGCHSPKDCNGQTCCIELDAGVASITCQSSCPAPQQSCVMASDCGDGGECLAQTCTVEGTTVQVTTCGAISSCTQ